MIHQKLLVCQILIILATAEAESTKAASYRIDALSMPPYSHDSYAYRISDTGFVLGDVGSRAAVWQGTSLSYIDHTSPYDPKSAINNLGQSPIGLPDPVTGLNRPFIWSATGLMPLSVLRPDAGYEADGINDSGEVVGGEFFNSQEQAVRWTAAGPAYLAVPPGYQSVALGINNAGVAVGGVVNPKDNCEPAYWKTDGTLAVLPTHTIPGLVSACLYSITDSGILTGWSTIETSAGTFEGRAIQWASADAEPTLIPIVNVDGRLSSPNDSGQMVATIDGLDYLFSGTDYQLLDPLIENLDGWSITYVLDVNNSSVIAGYGLHDGDQSAFILTPTAVSSDGAPIPEPLASLWLIPLGAMGRRTR